MLTQLQFQTMGIFHISNSVFCYIGLRDKGACTSWWVRSPGTIKKVVGATDRMTTAIRMETGL